MLDYLPKAYADGDDLEARNAMAMASCYGGLALRRALVGYVHAIAHQFGMVYQTPHGLANGIVLTHVLEFSKDHIEDRLATLCIATKIGNAGESNAVLAQQFIDKIVELKAQLDIPDTLSSLQRQHIPDIRKAALSEARFKYAVPKYMSKEDCDEILYKMLES